MIESLMIEPMIECLLILLADSGGKTAASKTDKFNTVGMGCQ